MGVADTWTQLGSSMAGVMFAVAMLQKFLPNDIAGYFLSYIEKYFFFLYPYIQITFHEYNSNRFERSNAYSAIESYLGAISTSRAKRFKCELIKKCKSLVLTMDDYEEITDEFRGVKVWWKSSKTESNNQTINLSHHSTNDEKRYYALTFNVCHRDTITNAYLNFIIQQGKEIAVKNRQRKLFTNVKSSEYYDELWSHIVFKHPASFETLAMEAQKKSDIINDLITFSKSKDYYAAIGKPWKRGYLLYGPPGTGKSTMIAAMANLLGYHIYDLELTSVKDNTELRQLLIEIKSKSIIVIEDIDCSLELTGKRASESNEDTNSDDEDADENGSSKIKKAVGQEGEKKKKGSEVTLSGLLNFIDGLWSASGGERIIIFTTNHVEKLDPALIRRGRMDKHIELSYCCYESFKILAKNYLKIEFHPLFDEIKALLEENKVTPADVAENLMPKNIGDPAEHSLKSLIQAIEAKKEVKGKKICNDEEENNSSWKRFAKGFRKKKIKEAA